MFILSGIALQENYHLYNREGVYGDDTHTQSMNQWILFFRNMG